jgi:hypothetical protein
MSDGTLIDGSITQTTTVNPTDRLYVVVDPTGTPSDHFVSHDDLHKSRSGNYSVLSYSTLALAVAGIGATVATLEVPASAAVTADLTIPSNITLFFSGTGVIPVSSTKTLTIQGSFFAPARQVFSGAGTVILSAPGQPIVSQWWGALGNAKIVTDAAMTASSAMLTSATAGFTASDVGKLVDVSRVGAATTLMAVITGYTSATVVTLSVPASYTGSSKTISLDSATIATGSMTAGSATLTAGSSFFTSDDVGKMVSVTDVGAKNKVGTISAYTNSTTVTLSFSAAVAATATRGIYGTNDKAAIASAIAALPTGGHVYFPKGNYAVGSSNAITTSNLLFTGAGMNASVLYSIGPVMLDSATDFDVFNINNNTSNIGFRELGFSGSNWNAQTTTFASVDSSGIYVSTSGVSNISADRCRFDSFWGIGFHAPGSSGLTIMASTVVKDISITNCEASYNSYDGLNPNPWSGLIVKGCYLHHNGTAGLECSTSLAGISGNICYYNFQGGLSVGGYGSTQTSDSVSVVGNNCQFNGAYGITLASNQANTSVVGNTCRANGYAGIETTAGGGSVDKNSVIANNICSSNGSFGILSGHSYTLIVGNKCYDEGLTGYSQGTALQVAGGSCRVISNDLTGVNTDISITGANTWFDASNIYDPSRASVSGSGTLLSPVYRGYKSGLANASAIGFVDIVLASDAYVSGTITYAARQSAGGVAQIRSGVARFSAVQHSGSYTTEIAIINEAGSTTSGTLTLSFTIVSGTNKITLKATGNSSVFGGGSNLDYTIHLDAAQTFTPL